MCWKKFSKNVAAYIGWNEWALKANRLAKPGIDLLFFQHSGLKSENSNALFRKVFDPLLRRGHIDHFTTTEKKPVCGKRTDDFQDWSA
jgi:hypothetical protein